MRTLAILPIKRFSAASQRLAAVLGGGSRRLLAQAMFSDVLAALRRVERVDSIAVVTADRDAETASYAEDVVVLPEGAEAGQSAATAVGIRHAIEAGFDRVLLVPGDTPLLEPLEVDGLLERSAADQVAAMIVPDRHGVGTNALVLSPPQALEPSFGPGSLERHVLAAREAGLAHRVEAPPSLLLDVDTPEDLAEVAAALESRRGPAASTRGALRQLERLQVVPRTGDPPSGHRDGLAAPGGTGDDPTTPGEAAERAGLGARA